MSNRFEGRGNLAAVPELKRVDVGGEERAVAEMRIYFDRSVPKEEGGFEDRGGFWLTANLWGERAEPAARLLPKGARVHVRGTLVRDTWKDKDSGEEHERFEPLPDTVSLDLGRVDQVSLHGKDGKQQRLPVPDTPPTTYADAENCEAGNTRWSLRKEDGQRSSGAR